jgi:hypothetical protein
MQDVHSFAKSNGCVSSLVENNNTLSHKLKRLENVIIEIFRRTAECAIFVREYTGHGFASEQSKFLYAMNSIEYFSQRGSWCKPFRIPARQFRVCKLA